MSTLLKAFRHQNGDLVYNLSKPERTSLNPYVQHHSGGLIVAVKDQESNVPGEIFYAKIHDTWGDPAQGAIVVHLYDPNAEDVNAHDVVLNFDAGSGPSAVALFHNDAALAAIWEVTR